MNERIEGQRENKNLPHESETPDTWSGRKSTHHVVDNRPETSQWKKIQAAANNSPQVKQLQSMQSNINNSARMRGEMSGLTSSSSVASPVQKMGLEEEEESMQMKSMPVQRMEEEEESMQMKSKPVQRMEEEEESMQMKSMPVQRMEEEEESMQMKSMPVQRMEEEEESMQMKNAPVQKKENSTGLPGNLQTGIENLSGMSMEDVKVHRNSDKPAKLQAHAYAQGSDIHLGPGQEKHLPHEAWHVVQQKQGRVKPTMQMKGKVNVNDNEALEKEADVMGAKVLHASNQEDNLQSTNPSNPQLQRKKADGSVSQLYKEYSDSGETDSKKDVHWKSNGTPLRVSEDGTAAIAQQWRYGGQEMYIDASRLPDINSDLKKVNAPLEFVEKGGRNVEGAPPENIEGTKKTLAEVKPVELADNSKVVEIPDDCGQAAHTVTGAFAEGKTLHGKYNDKGDNTKYATKNDPELMKYEIMVEYFGDKIKNSDTIVEDVAAIIETEKELKEQLEPFKEKVNPIMKEYSDLIEEYELNYNSEDMKIFFLEEEKNAISDDDPNKVEKVTEIDLKIKAIRDNLKIYEKATNLKEEALMKKMENIMSEKIGNRTAMEVLNEYNELITKHKELEAVIMQPYNEQTDKEKFDKKAGINRHANPEVGESYTISSGGNNYADVSTWNFHWGGVIFKSTTGSDNITMENYAGNEDYEWQLQMYGVPTNGSKRIGQTFHEDHEATKQHGDNPTTLTTEKR